MEPHAAPPDAGALREVFGPGADQALRFAELLATEGIRRGVLGPREAPRIWDRHLFNSAVVSAALPETAAVVDLGSGAGLPGIPLALARPDLRVTLVEPLLRRTRWLDEAVAALGLGTRVRVVRGRAPGLPLDRHDAVVSRAVAPLAALVPLCLPLCRPGGLLVALKGENAEDELADARHALAEWGVPDARVARFGEGLLDRPTIAVVARTALEDTAPQHATPRPGGTPSGTGRRRP